MVFIVAKDMQLVCNLQRLWRAQGCFIQGRMWALLLSTLTHSSGFIGGLILCVCKHCPPVTAQRPYGLCRAGRKGEGSVHLLCASCYIMGAWLYFVLNFLLSTPKDTRERNDTNSSILELEGKHLSNTSYLLDLLHWSHMPQTCFTGERKTNILMKKLRL